MNIQPLPKDTALFKRVAELSESIPAKVRSLVPASDIVTPDAMANYYEWYAAIASLLKPKNYLEIGVYGGGSAIATALGAGEALKEIVLIDNESDGRKMLDAIDRIKKMTRATIVGFCGEHEGDSQRMYRLPASSHGVDGYDLITVDGDHRIGPAYYDLRLALERLAPGGHIIVDDYNWPWVTKAVDMVLSDEIVLADGMVLSDDSEAAHSICTFTGTAIIHPWCTEKSCSFRRREQLVW